MGGFPTIHHNEVRDLTANLLTEACHNVCVKPPLQPLSGETLSYTTANRDDSARLDIRAFGFWGLPQQQAFFDVKFTILMHLHTVVLNWQPVTDDMKEKQRAYEQHVREIDYGSFTPLVFSTAGGMGNAATTTYRRLVSMIATKQELPDSVVMGWLRYRVTFSLIQSTIMCLRGSRLSKCNVSCGQLDSIDLVFHEGRVPHGD